MPEKLRNLALVDFPLRGEWRAITTPAKAVPSHGTDFGGTRYAYDFMRAEWSKGKPVYHKEGIGIRSHFSGIPLAQWLTYAQPVYCPKEGRVIASVDGIEERSRTHPIKDGLRALKNGIVLSKKNLSVEKLAGNHLIIESGCGFFLFAHFKTGSLEVRAGQSVRQGNLLGLAGHSGNSTAPHLHFQLMDSPDFFKARGLPVAFTNCEQFTNGTWQASACLIPGTDDRIRA